MPSTDFSGDVPEATSAQWRSALTVLQEVAPAFVPANAHVTTAVVEYPPGGAGAPPHRHAGPVFGYVLGGELLFELEGLPERVIHAGEAFWEPGGDVIHYQDANHRRDIPVRFIVTMLCVPGAPMLALVLESELAEREARRAPRGS
ncbi:MULTISPECIES: cupin domain-containing protein [Kribbella]|jgi:quercetin dioxygenase-like cupin family protein|uniref:Cupin domain n=1 Tax=Kribbella pratensis TaxID=2512112 RepID=A0ABY2F7V6_9ACTN|nr:MULTISPECIES: cupin domain-containing protein [Kribbella]TDW79477.1 cupin domain [Kribbella sp. VKM Ac-2566]TDW84370.1 cupin domain [Kribbella pratensis]